MCVAVCVLQCVRFWKSHRRGWLHPWVEAATFTALDYPLSALVICRGNWTYVPPKGT